jgi:acyl carrier protein
MSMKAQTKIIEIISDILNNVDVNGSTSRQTTPEWNSLKHMEILFAIEEEFEIQYSVEEMVEISSVLDIVNSLVRREL